MPIVATLFLGLGYIVAFPALRWHQRDLSSFRRPLWAGYGSRTARVRGAWVSYLAFGWPELFMAWGWRASQTRAGLVSEREQMREARDRELGRPPG